MWFRCFFRGENFPGQLAGVTGLVGFFVTRFVEAASAEEAESLLVAELRAEPVLAKPAGYEPSGIACVYLEEIDEIRAEQVPSPPPGFAWFPMEVDER
jgi:hypothetical protein